MLVLWLIVWLFKDTPVVSFEGGDLNNWAVALVVCALIDVFGTRNFL